MKTNKKAFTLVEILVVVGLIAILAAITFIAINPAKNFAQTRNTQRRSDVGEILSAISQYLSEQGHTIGGLGTIPTCPATSPIGSGASNVNLATVLVEEYIPGIPKDPLNGSDANTGYTICQSSNGRVTIAAPGAELSETISARR